MTNLDRPQRDDSDLGLGMGWNLDPDWPSLLLAALRNAIDLRDEGRLVGFAELGVELCREGQVTMASAIAQILVVTSNPEGSDPIRGGVAAPEAIVETVSAHEPEPERLLVSIDRLAGAIADAIDMAEEAARLSWRAGRGFDALVSCAGSSLKKSAE